MSIRPAIEPDCTSSSSGRSTEVVIDARARELGGIAIQRVLPSARRRAVGAFTFLDHMGEMDLAPGQGIDVPPHPHIGLATLTYLFEGAIEHRDSLGSAQVIRPGDVNWMVAGRGVVHSERTPQDLRVAPSRLHGLQFWVALPRDHEEAPPTFAHHPGASIPEREQGGVVMRVLVGSAYGVSSPVEVLSPSFCVVATMPVGAELPLTDAYEERAAYVVRGAIGCGDERAEAGRMVVFTPGARVTLRAEQDARVLLLGGAPLDGPRHMEWNFVSTSKERIAQARADWKARRFPTVPGDDGYVPFPE